MKNANEKRRTFKKDQSVFRDWKEDTPQLLERCSQLDKMLWKAPRFIKDPEEVAKCWKVIENNMAQLKDIFVHLASISNFPNITQLDFSDFCVKCNFLDENVTISTIDLMFIASNYEIKVDNENPDRALCRYEFYEVLLRIANAKYREGSGVCQTHS